MEETKGLMCDHCTKEDCKNCVSEDGKNFCCENCCNDFKEQQKAPKEEPANICKFC